MGKGIEAIIVEISEEKTILEVNKQRLILDKSCLPDGVKKGAKIKLYFLNPEGAISSEKKLAKTILEEILNGK